MNYHELLLLFLLTLYLCRLAVSTALLWYETKNRNYFNVFLRNFENRSYITVLNMPHWDFKTDTTFVIMANTANTKKTKTKVSRYLKQRWTVRLFHARNIWVGEKGRPVLWTEDIVRPANKINWTKTAHHINTHTSASANKHTQYVVTGCAMGLLKVSARVAMHYDILH